MVSRQRAGAKVATGSASDLRAPVSSPTVRGTEAAVGTGPWCLKQALGIPKKGKSDVTSESPERGIDCPDGLRSPHAAWVDAKR